MIHASDFHPSSIDQAVSEDKQVQACRKGRNSYVIFDDVDVSLVIEWEVEGENMPVPML